MRISDTEQLNGGRALLIPTSLMKCTVICVSDICFKRAANASVNASLCCSYVKRVFIN